MRISQSENVWILKLVRLSSQNKKAGTSLVIYDKNANKAIGQFTIGSSVTDDVIASLLTTASIYGYPTKLITDNQSNFSEAKFLEWLHLKGIYLATNPLPTIR